MFKRLKKESMELKELKKMIKQLENSLERSSREAAEYNKNNY